MKQIRFKVLRPGDTVVSFTKHNLVIQKSSGEFFIYTLTGVEEGKPNFFKEYEEVTTFTSDLIEEGFAIVRDGNDFKIFQVSDYDSIGIPIFDRNYCLIITSGVGKIQSYDTDTQITAEIPAKVKNNE